MLPFLRQPTSFPELTHRVEAKETLLCKEYEEISSDRPAPGLVHFFQSYRACIRTTIAIRHFDEEKFRPSAKWPRRALEYLQLAEQHIQECANGIQPHIL
ncbi:MAG: hypothetical protein ABI656_13265 [bacterium]